MMVWQRRNRRLCLKWKSNATAQVHITVVILIAGICSGQRAAVCFTLLAGNVRFESMWWSSVTVRLGSAKKLPLSSISVSDNAQVDTLAKLRIAVASPEVTGYFI